MGRTRRIAIALSGIAGRLGLTPVPATAAARVARVTELYAGYREAFPDVPEVQPAALRRELALGAGPVLVDVRSEAERSVSTLPGAVPAAAIEAELGRWRERRLVACCTIGYRSGLWARRQREAGLEVANLVGGVLGWAEAGGAFADRDGRATLRVHVYGPAWDLLPAGYRSVW